MNAELGVVVPAFNAEEALARTLSRLAMVRLPAMAVIVIDDGSHDATADVARRTAREKGLRLEVLRHPVNRGYGAAQKTGLRRTLALGCRCHVLLHADGQYAPEEMPRLVEPLLDGRADVVVGSRIASGRALAEGMPLLRYLGNRWISRLENLVFQLDLTEYHSGYIAYSARALERIEFDTLTDRFHFDGEMLLCAGKLGLSISEAPISTCYGPGSTSLSPLPYLAEIAGVMRRYLRKGYFFQHRPGDKAS